MRVEEPAKGPQSVFSRLLRSNGIPPKVLWKDSFEALRLCKDTTGTYLGADSLTVCKYDFP